MSNNFGEFLYGLRKEKGMTQAELADMLDLTNKAVSKWETGETMPETAQLVPLSRIFDVTVDELLNGRRAFNPEAAGGGQDAAIQGSATEQSPPDEPEEPLSVRYIAAVSCGVGLIILGALALIILQLLGVPYTVAVPILLAAVAVGAPLCAYAGNVRGVENRRPTGEALRRGRRLALGISAGIALCILSPIGLVVFSSRFEQDGAAQAGMIAAGFAVFAAVLIPAIIILIIFGSLWGNFKEHGLADAGRPPEKETRGDRISGGISGLIMALATAIFLTLGFVADLWHIAWIAFPIGGVLCWAVDELIGIFDK